MQSISQLMTRDVTVIAPHDNVQHAAQMMKDRNVGSLPVCDGQRLVGMITDRDIAVRAVAAGRSPKDCHVTEVMTGDVLWCYEDQTVGAILDEMGDEQVRRVPVVNADMQLVGIVSLGDLATRHAQNVERTLEEISYPSEPRRPGGSMSQARHST